jgi:DNA cross-link repair 1A protein
VVPCTDPYKDDDEVLIVDAPSRVDDMDRVVVDSSTTRTSIHFRLDNDNGNKHAVDKDEHEDSHEDLPWHCGTAMAVTAAAASKSKRETSHTTLHNNNNNNNHKDNVSHDNDNVCFICGSSLSRITSGLKGRLQHIKKCAKKYGVQAQDMKLDHDDDDYDDNDNDVEDLVCHPTETTTNTTSTNRRNEKEMTFVSSSQDKKPAAVTNNPYARNKQQTTNTTTNHQGNIHTNLHPKPLQQPQQWHAGAQDDLALATTITNYTSISDSFSTTSTQNNSSSTHQPSSTKQTTLTSFFTAPLRNLNKVLLASAKNMAKTKQIQQIKQKQKQQKQQQTNNGTSNYNINKRGRWKTRQDYAHKTCPPYKRIPGTDFICDGFLYAKPSLSQTYFLSHFHSDHYGGIDRSWNAGIIYCSLPTANLVHARLGVDRQYLHPLGLESPTILMETTTGKPVTVTLLDANHCPGAVMFLFQVNKRTILHVGDFRWDKQLMLSYPPLQALASWQQQQQQPNQQQQQQLDELFLDTTYCEEKYTLPSQHDTIEAAVQVAVQQVEQSRVARERLLLLFGAYTIGKERLYLAVAERLNVKIYVDSQRYKILSALEWPAAWYQRLTTSRNESNLWVVPLGHINLKRLPEYLTGLSSSNNNNNNNNKYDRVVGFRPTGWSNRPDGKLVTTATRGNLTVHSVPYSEHSSFPELVDCIRTLKPKKIIPTVTVAKSQQQVDLLLRHVLRK